MPIWPDATWRPTSGLANDPPIRAIGLVLHVAATEASSLFGYFNGRSGGVESHGFTTYDGDNEQYRDTDREADANWSGNSWMDDGVRKGMLSWESQGLAAGQWTDAQLLEFKELIVWLDKVEPYFRPTPATSVRSGGVGYHIQFGTGTEKLTWSKYKGKVCPGPRRIEQYHDIIVPWLKSGGSEKGNVKSPSANKTLPRGRSGLLEGQVYGPDAGDRESWKDGHENSGVAAAVEALSNFLVIKKLVDKPTRRYTPALMSAMAAYFKVANGQAGKKLYRQDGAVGEAEWNYIVRAVSRM
jgi:hypothetical protein